ncbi:DUF983 domain-containing protein [Polaribacter undariae]|uniref:DUF983 domain-containing protein n=1 Tax=Polaribacter sejongensis TaxID=985043 RepID=A0AAJ1QVB9_9FLAO|nr:DUF983 domain-containing protein [Polaribacter undariae]MDN3618727.1 DUF983 domain-containing protein [Polaribacter undariae]UWD33833.1 DUF983 domain-containing protein [Polaribacter undariae]
MLKKGTKLYSIFKAKCPRCHEGEFFAHKFTFNPNKVTKLHNNCPNCNLKYMMEPSFFYGAMYVNYGLTVALSVAVFVISSLFFGLSLLQCFAAIVIALLILAPFNLRLSRIIWINMFIHFDKRFKKKQL